MLALAAIILAAGCSRDRPGPAKARPFEKTRLARLPHAERRQSTLVLSDDGEAYACGIVKDDGGLYVVGSQGVGPVHQEIGRPAFAPHTHRLFYWGVDKVEDGKRYVLHADGSVIATPFRQPGVLAFSDAGGHWVAIGIDSGPNASEPGKLHVLVEGKELGPYSDATVPAVDRDGHVAYLVRENYRNALVVDGVERRGFADPKSGCAAEAADRAHGATGPAGLELPLHHTVRYLADGSMLVVTRDAEGWGIYHDETRLASYPRSTADSVDDDCKASTMFSYQSIRKAEEAPVAVWFERLEGKEERWRVVRNGAPVDDVICNAQWTQQPPEISADGRHVAYACPFWDERGEERVQIVRDGVRSGAYMDVWGVALSPNGAHVTYGASDGTEPQPWTIDVDGEVRTRRYGLVWRPRVSDDGATVAWESQLQRTADASGRFGIDRRVLGSFDDVLWGPEVQPGDRMAWIIRRGHSLTRVTVPFAARAEIR
jgi:hypothetical protein